MCSVDFLMKKDKIIKGRGGEIGNRDRFRTYCRKACGFESLPRHKKSPEGDFPFIV